MKKDFIVPEISHCDVYLIYGGDEDTTHAAVLPTDIIGKIPSGDISNIIPKLNKRQINRIEKSLQKYTSFATLEDVSKIEIIPSKWCGRLTVTYHIFDSKKEAEETLHDYALQIAGNPVESKNNDDGNEWGSSTPKKNRTKKKSRKPVTSDSKEVKESGKQLEFDERAPTEEDLEKNIVIEKGIGKNLAASLGNTRIAQAPSRKALIDKLDEWIDKSGKDLRIFHLKKERIEELDRLGDLVDTWKYYDTN